MTSSGVVEIQQIQAMLAECAPGHSIKTTEHYHCVMWNRRTYPSLPLGAHGKKRERKAEIRIGHVRHRIRLLGIDADCAKKHIPQLAS